MTYELLFIRGPLKNRKWTIPVAESLKIGRGKDCEIRVVDISASQYHCYVELREGKPWVGDLASDNGLVVNGGVLRECELDPADVVSVGDSDFKVIPVAEKKRRGLASVIPWLMALGALCAVFWLGRDKFAPTGNPPAQEQPESVAPVTASVTNEVRVVNVTEVTNLTEIVVIRTMVDANGVKRVETNRVDKVTRKSVPGQSAEVKPTPESFGPIPNVKYTWWNVKQEPDQVKFQLANGANIELVPLKKGSFLMSNCPQDGRRYHKVTLTYDLWMSRTMITVDQLRELFALDDADIRKLEKALPSDVAVCREIPYSDITNYCAYLTHKYKSQIPEQYEFRLPTDAEVDRAVSGESADLVPLPNGDHTVALRLAESRFVAITSRTEVAKLNLLKVANWWPWHWNAKCLVAGLNEPHKSGVADLWWSGVQPIADRYSATNDGKPVAVEFGEEETDPYRVSSGADLTWRRWATERWTWSPSTTYASSFHIVLGPVLPTANTRTVKFQRVVPFQEYDWKIPKKLNRPKTLDFKLANGAVMTMCACPAGNFSMSGGSNLTRGSHEVKISRPFWMSRTLVTLDQYRDFARYDFEGSCRDVERELSGFSLSPAIGSARVESYCAYLNTTYGHLLPPGYVFRLPTEAEHEYAFRAGTKGSLADTPASWRLDSPESYREIQSLREHRKSLVRVLERGAMNLQDTGAIESSNAMLFISGRGENSWGICDMENWGAGGIMTLDVVQNWVQEKNPQYKNNETDPFHYELADEKGRHLIRAGWIQRYYYADYSPALFHIVVGPDLVGELQRGDRPLGSDEFKDAFTLPIVKGAAMRTAEQGVLRLMADCEKDVHEGKMTRKEASAKALRFSDNFYVNGKSKRERLLLMKGAFTLAVHGAAKDEAMLCWRHFEQAFGDSRRAFMLTNVIHSACVPYADERLKKCLAEWTQRAQLAADREKWESVLKAKPRDAEAHARLGAALVALDEWGLALTHFEKAAVQDKALAAAAQSERARTGKPNWLKLGDFWWQYAEGWPEISKNAYRAHAAELYIKGVVAGAITGADKVRCEDRIGTARKNVPAKMPHAPEGALYMVVDLSNGPKADYYPVSWLKDVPKGGWTDEYKTTKLVMRRIEPGSFESVDGLTFLISRPFLTGVFEVTQRQYELVMGQNPATFKDDGRKPVETVSYDRIRGDKLGRSWPMSDDVDEDSFLGRLRRKTGLCFDLPTEIQWEYVCRAGTQGEFDGETDPSVMDKLGRHRGNGGRIPDPKGTKDENGNVKIIDAGPAVVGSYRPNPWGLYDMHGNVWEWCLDRHPSDVGGWASDGRRKECQSDPNGITCGLSRILRGGGWRGAGTDSGASWRRRHESWRGWGELGFRLACPVK